MFLLILCSSDCRRTGLSSFTFHDVSINTIRKTKPAKKFHNFTFHDVSINTFFVSPYGIGQAIFTFHDVSINTKCSSFLLCVTPAFTFHDVSINTVYEQFYEWKFPALHSTMFLLILCLVSVCDIGGLLYIPRCFY